jgi:hypothetical protein
MKPTLVCVVSGAPVYLKRYVDGKVREIAHLQVGPNDTKEGLYECVEDFRRNGLPAPEPEAA